MLDVCKIKETIVHYNHKRQFHYSIQNLNGKTQYTIVQAKQIEFTIISQLFFQINIHFTALTLVKSSHKHCSYKIKLKNAIKLRGENIFLILSG
jgi:uncharacterized HAD superfamily protein